MPFRRKNCAKCPRNSWPPRSKRLQRMTASSITLLAQDWLCFHHKIYFTWKYCRNPPFAVILVLQVKFYIKDWLWPSARVFHLMDKRSTMPAPCINLCLFWFYISLYPMTFAHPAGCVGIPRWKTVEKTWAAGVFYRPFEHRIQPEIFRCAKSIWFLPTSHCVCAHAQFPEDIRTNVSTRQRIELPVPPLQCPHAQNLYQLEYKSYHDNPTRR